MIIQIQLTALILLAAAASIAYVIPEEKAGNVLVALTVIVLLGSLAVLFVTSLLRIWA